MGRAMISSRAPQGDRQAPATTVAGTYSTLTITAI